MDAEPDAETNGYCPSTTLGSEDSDEDETSQEEPPTTDWNELSIIERVGLNSVEMSDKEVEMAFCQIALAFRCDQYTLKQRLQAEEHDRNLAEENIQLELTRGRETLEALKGLCLDSKRSKILQKLELSLDILGGTVERISNTAEVLGAVHQEARVCRAVELMVAHVENLRKQHERNATELEEARKAVQQQNSWRNADARASSDPEDSDSRRRNSQQNNRRRVSISVISSTSQEKIKRDLKKRSRHGGSSSKKSTRPCPSPTPSSESSCSGITKDDSVDDRPVVPDEAPAEASAPQPSSNPDPECLPAEQDAKIEIKSAPADALRKRHKSKSAKKSKTTCRRRSVGGPGSLWRRFPLPQWMHRCHWPLVFMYLLVFFCVITLTYVLLEAL